ncbi:MAG TPA: enoyl-CoA hydratase-related protein [Actinomycetota bacterium]|jgi:enoyl-CoA hydratase/carnithine racemase|nr:enoyl-CoA hydratase-related protein [Actinomycetota bacterium]
MAEFDTLRYGVHDGVATIEMARSDKRNAINAQMFQELGDAAERAAFDPGIRVVLVKGQGPSFSAGIDITLLGQLAGTRGARFRSFVHTAQRPFLLLARMAKPTVAAVQGHAIGAGFQLALACDLRIVAEDARFSILEVQFGLVPDLGGSVHLARLVGQARTKEIVWTGRAIEAEEAERVGIVNRVVPAAALEKEAETYAREIAAAPPLPVSMTKALINRSHETPLETSLEREAQAQAACIDSEDHREAIAAYLEKRPPRFTGR